MPVYSPLAAVFKIFIAREMLNTPQTQNFAMQQAASSGSIRPSLTRSIIFLAK